MTQIQARQGKRLQLRGRVQGLGVRPALTRLARHLELTGRIWNASNGVTIEIFGHGRQILSFEQQIRDAMPAGAQLEACETKSIPFRTQSDFEIVIQDHSLALSTEVPRDIGICQNCIDEIIEPSDRRFRYWLNSCAACGPRFTMLSAMPYERSNTSMGAFPLCDACRCEYASTQDRRFHAQGISCPDCGPKLCVSDPWGETVSADEPIQFLAEQLRSGKIVAVKGVGGYQLLCDATCETVVQRLRELKAREAKAFAILVLNGEAAAQLADLSSVELETLTDVSNPILLASPLPGHSIAHSVLLDSPLIGLMLPTTGIHYGLAQSVSVPLVCTSANLEEEPMLSERPPKGDPSWKLADYWLHHDRVIVAPLDDSVVRVIGQNAQSYRLARGLAPLPLRIRTQRTLLALGSELKSSLATSNSEQAALGPHIGDLANVKKRQRYQKHLSHFENLYGKRNTSYVTDLHPDFYGSTYIKQRGEQPVHVQHHLAHIFATRLDHPEFTPPFLGVSWDGYGWGLHGESWGGEIFYIRNAHDFDRIATLRPLLMPGGDQAVRQPWRLASALLLDTFGPGDWVDHLQEIWPDCPVTSLVSWMKRSQSTMGKTTSVGRLFDAVSSLLTHSPDSSYEGHAAIRLEGLASTSKKTVKALPFEIGDGLPFELDWRPLIRHLWQRVSTNDEPEQIALGFHHTLASFVVEIQKSYPDLPLVLSGGVFQNRILVESLKAQLPDNIPVLFPKMIPANDGGLAAGQIAFHEEILRLAANPHVRSDGEEKRPCV